MNDELLALQDAFDSVLEASLPITQLLEGAAHDRPLALEARSALIEMGLHAIALEEADDGFGRRPDWIAALMEVAGRRLLPPVLRDEALLLAPLLAECSRRDNPAAAEWLNLLSAGEIAGSVRGVVAGPDLQRIEATESEFSCSDLPIFVPPDPAIVGVLTPEGGWLFDAADPRLHLDPVHGIEAGNGAARLTIDPGPVAAARQIGGDTAIVLLRTWQLGLTAEAVGCADHVTNESVIYAQDRDQFGQPIAVFQAVAHLLADMKQRTELGRSVLARLVSLMDHGAINDVDDLLIGARLWVPSATREVVEIGIQVHGGMGFTWEVGLHLWYRRALHIQALLGGEVGAAASSGDHFIRRAREMADASEGSHDA